jgi:hypothetical protein
LLTVIFSSVPLLFVFLFIFSRRGVRVFVPLCGEVGISK